MIMLMILLRPAPLILSILSVDCVLSLSPLELRSTVDILLPAGILQLLVINAKSICFSTRAKRCRINLCKRHRFAIAISKYHLLVNSSLRLDFLLYDVASILRLDVEATCWYLATAGLKTSADSSARRRFISFTSLLIC
ncbi:pentatricopeptide repeat-containing protein mitochondrial [Dorcoceras hygrometricum]|uniref:Pentatricopeptide repeat-containing protein mitochondrial n=1 Tax=Dorcoceras hygrometricum TaxID=472368 RepID=A0A2Z7BJJ4_9LAMI|nr:pentatricopeptide repeat-containing protein mitochondrial [Dorcoceras hygrometricum]